MSILYQLAVVWHFLLSEILLQHEDDQALASAALLHATSAAKHSSSLEFDAQTYHFKDLSLVAKLELLIGLSSARRVDVGLFKSVMEDCGLNWEALFEQYVSKNVLNFFRQDHGYKEGTYQKLWQGREDNEHLVELMGSLDTANPDYPELLYSGLLQRYPG